MKLSNKSTRQPKDVYDKFTGDFAFNKTTVPVKLAQVGSSLVSRSQAKRILARFEQFKTVQLDFSGVEWVGQAFADEIFRVYKNAHPDVQIEVVNANEDIGKMIQGGSFGLLIGIIISLAAAKALGNTASREIAQVKKRVMSAAARAKTSKATKARWAKFRAEKRKKAKAA